MVADTGVDAVVVPAVVVVVVDVGWNVGVVVAGWIAVVVVAG